MRGFITKRPVWLSLMAMMLIVAGFGAYLAVGAHSTKAAPAAYHAKAAPNLAKHGYNTPLARSFNGTLQNQEGAPSDDDTSPSPTLSALCQQYANGTLTDPYHNPAPNVDQINGDTVVSVGSQTGCDAAQNETTIVVNPSAPNNLVAGTNDYRV